jgi:hypothetical protein
MLKQTAPGVEVEVSVDEAPHQLKVVDLFTGICCEESEEASMADEDWFKEHASEVKQRLGRSHVEITLKSLQAALYRTAAWKAPGFDGVFGFFIKKVTAVHESLVQTFTAIQNNQRTHPVPEWFTSGPTVLIPKNRKKHLLADDNARPINCLPALYKLLTKKIERDIAQALDRVLTDKQKGCQSQVFGAQHQLIIDRVLTELKT